ncbi:hypothetical protein C7S18_19810 [Ahniella affigens]|uniref:Transcription regulator HTH AraC- type ligand binding domain-containing protein n=1 Tax=Ahniella affigens TaxID=2021234 RepID=A0A2P1PWQ0_9GAMM|nr:hypothetical protein C7S18_19810 [Ahniella affigens]
MTSAAPHFHCEELLRTATVVVCDLQCDGGLPHQEPTSQEPAFLFPYRGMYVRHCGDDAVVAEAGQVLFQNPNEATRFSHPIAGGDATLWLQIAPEMLQELVPNNLRVQHSMHFSIPRLRIDPRTQVLVSLLRHSLKVQIAEPLEAESLSLTLVHRALGPATSLAVEATRSRRKLVDRTKLVLIGRRIGHPAKPQSTSKSEGSDTQRNRNRPLVTPDFEESDAQRSRNSPLATPNLIRGGFQTLGKPDGKRTSRNLRRHPPIRHPDESRDPGQSGRGAASILDPDFRRDDDNGVGGPATVSGAMNTASRRIGHPAKPKSTSRHPGLDPGWV